MGELGVLEKRVVEGCAKFMFPHDFYLMLVPYRDEERNITGLNSVILLQRGVYQALAIDKRSIEWTQPQNSGFSTKYGVEQKELARYWNAAIQACEELREEQELYIITHQGWDIKQRLEQNKEKAFGKP